MKKLYYFICFFLFFVVTGWKINAQITTFNYTGAAQTYTVPACVNSITVDVKGGAGGDSPNGVSFGGNGGRVQAIIPVMPGQILNIYVGQSPSAASAGVGGWNGGGTGGSSSGGGGGASDIRQGGSALSNRVIVAGGGGGAGYNCFLGGDNGGNGGGLIGGNGLSCNAQDPIYAGQGGTQTSGGAGATGGGFPGSLGNGGNWGTTYCGCGGGGGGGYYGGGGGSYSAGGGGSSYTISTATGVTHTQGSQSTNGQILITSIVSTGPATPGPITGTTSVCSGSSQTYSVSPVTGATSYIWTLPSGWSGSSTTNSINATAGATGGNITVKATNSCGTSPASTMALTVTTALVANAGADVSICPGGAVTLNASGGNTYSWSPATGLSCANCPDPIATPSVTTIYEVTVSSGTCSSDSDTIQVTVNALPTADAGTDVTICSGNSTSLNASGGASYNWNPTTGLNNPNIANPIANPAITTTYIVDVTDVNGCMNEDSVVVNVTTALVANAGPDASICEGGTATLNASGGSNYSWSPTTGLSCITCPSPGASPSVTTTYEVTVSSGTCATSSDMIQVTVNSPTASAGSDVTICSGSSTTLNASGGVSYSWSPATGLNDPNIAAPAANPTTTTIYEVTVTDASGCTGTDTVTVTVDICDGISSTSGNMHMLIFPNPARDALNIQINHDGLKHLNIEMMNIQGQVVYIDKAGNISGNYKSQIDVSSLSKGVYYLRVKEEGFLSVRKIIVQ